MTKYAVLKPFKTVSRKLDVGVPFSDQDDPSPHTFEDLIEREFIAIEEETVLQTEDRSSDAVLVDHDLNPEEE